MEIRTLEGLPFPLLVDAILRAFEGYFVPMNPDPAYWQDRFRCAGVDLSRSYALFDDDAPVAFIIQGFGTIDGRSTAYNAGTGVLPAYRGQRVVDRLYAHAVPYLKHADVSHCSLEVIDRNTPALRAYERVGFHVDHRWKCFKGTLAQSDLSANLVLGDLRTANLGDDRWACWEHRMEALLRSSGRQVLYTLGGDPANGHVVIDLSNGRIARLGVADEEDEAQWTGLLEALSHVKKEVVLVNVHPQRRALITALGAAGLQNHIDQLEMRMELA